MRSQTIGLFIFGTLAASTSALAQTTPEQPRGVATPSVTSPAVAPSTTSSAPSATTPAVIAPRAAAADSVIVEAATLEAGANSFTEGQAKSRFEDAGFTSIQGLTKDDAGFWRARGTRNGPAMDIAMDFRGRIAAGPGVVTLGSGNARVGTPASPTSTTGSAPARDGTPGNPPSTMTGRTADRLQGETPRADGTPGNPAGTAAGRAIERATGTPPAASTATPSR